MLREFEIFDPQMRYRVSFVAHDAKEALNMAVQYYGAGSAVVDTKQRNVKELEEAAKFNEDIDKFNSMHSQALAHSRMVK